jgi:prophage regulatory protein
MKRASRIRGPLMEDVVLLDLVALRRRGIRVSKSTIARLEAKGRFPKRVRIGDHSVAWLKTEIDAYIEALSLARGRAS